MGRDRVKQALETARLTRGGAMAANTVGPVDTSALWGGARDCSWCPLTSVSRRRNVIEYEQAKENANHKQTTKILHIWTFEAAE